LQDNASAVGCQPVNERPIDLVNVRDFEPGQCNRDISFRQLHGDRAGHRQPIFRRVDEKQISWLDVRGVGAYPAQDRPQVERAPGQTPVLFDDPFDHISGSFHVPGQRNDFFREPTRVVIGQIIAGCSQSSLPIGDQQRDGVTETLRRKLHLLCYNSVSEATVKLFSMIVLVAIAPTGVVFAQAVATPAPGASAVSKAEEQVRQAEKDRFTAMIKADAGDLDKLLATELIYTHSNAQVQDKTSFIADIKNGAIKYLTIEPGDQTVHVFGTAAIVTGVAAVHVIQNGTDLSIKIRYTDVHLNRNGEWQMVAWEATRVP